MGPQREDVPLPQQLIDTHAHIDDPQFAQDRSEVIARATAAGVDRIIIIGYRPSGWDRAIATARSFAGGRVCLGIHPAHADEYGPTTADLLRAAIERDRDIVVGIGETGIDLYRPGPSLEQQRIAFKGQLDLAAELGLPTVVHQRAAEDECLAVLQQTEPGQQVVLHSFDAGPGTAAVARERNWILGVGGLMTRASNVIVREIIRDYPLELLVLETDSPYLVPNGVKARRNEPANVVAIARRMAELRDTTFEEIAEQTTITARRVFTGL
ncbi:MAG TPA: TatD family hydrolase [Thermomicrobiales bacterium]|nr:TatD family hydrolase [Thermomicrobiales bacterium]